MFHEIYSSLAVLHYKKQISATIYIYINWTTLSSHKTESEPLDLICSIHDTQRKVIIYKSTNYRKKLSKETGSTNYIGNVSVSSSEIPIRSTNPSRRPFVSRILLQQPYVINPSYMVNTICSHKHFKNILVSNILTISTSWSLFQKRVVSTKLDIYGITLSVHIIKPHIEWHWCHHHHHHYVISLFVLRWNFPQLPYSVLVIYLVVYVSRTWFYFFHGPLTLFTLCKFFVHMKYIA